MKGIVIWILGFFSFLAGANVINATIMWFNLGPTAIFTSYLISGLTIPVYVYFLVSFLVTLAFLGVTTHQVVSELSNAEEIDAIDQKNESFGGWSTYSAETLGEHSGESISGR